MHLQTEAKQSESIRSTTQTERITKELKEHLLLLQMQRRSQKAQREESEQKISLLHKTNNSQAEQLHLTLSDNRALKHNIKCRVEEKESLTECARQLRRQIEEAKCNLEDK